MQRNKLLAQIHIEKAGLRLSDEDYRADLQKYFSAGSAAVLTEPQLEEWLRMLKAKTIAPYVAKWELAENTSAAQKRHIAYLRNVLGWTNKQVDKYITGHFGLDDASWMSAQIARAVIIGMRKMLKRRAE